MNSLDVHRCYYFPFPGVDDDIVLYPFDKQNVLEK